MSMSELLYEFALRGTRPLMRVAGRFNGKVARGVELRRSASRRLRDWAARERDESRPLFWFHAPSVGEALMAQATIQALRAESARAQVAFTFFSPSAERIAPRVFADVTDVLPWDVREQMAPVLDALRPAAIVFVRTEVWPVLAREGARRDVPLFLINAVLSEDSSRLRAPARTLLRPAYGRLKGVGAVRDADARLIERLGVQRERIRVTGDARFDQVWTRVAQLDRTAAVLRVIDARFPLIVAGSTWPPDEDRLLVAFARLRARARARLVIAPHEPTTPHLRRIEESLAASGLSFVRLAQLERGALPHADVVIVDRVGVLADLYAGGTVAYVGGGFGNHGLHSVIEPAALGVPVLFGPRHGNAREAGELASAGGGFTVSGETELTGRLEALFENEDLRMRTSAAARRFVQERLGAAVRNARLVLGQEV